MVVAVDSPELIDGDRFLGRLVLTLADGSVIDVPSGASYHGPRCLFEETSFETAECLIHAGSVDGQVDWVRAFRVEDDGRIGPGFDTGKLIDVDLENRYVVTQWGGTYPWREAPRVDCLTTNVADVSDPTLLDHEYWLYEFDSDGYLTQMTCGIEG